MLETTISSSMVIQDFVNRLPGLVECVGKKIYIRHNLIGKITTNYLFKANNDAFGDQLCTLIRKADECGELSFTRPIYKAAIPKNQLVKVSSTLARVLFCSKEFDTLTKYFAEFDIVDYPELINMLAEFTPFFLDELIFPELSLEKYIKELVDIEKITFSKINCKANNKNTDITLTYEQKKQWIDTFSWIAEWGPSDLNEFFTNTAFISYILLGSIYKDKMADCYYSTAELAHQHFDNMGAITYYKEALEIDPDYAIARVALIRSQYFEGNYQEAFENYKLLEEHHMDKIFYIGEEEIILEFLIGYGKLEEAIKLSIFRIERTYPAMRRMHDHFGTLLVISDLSPNENGKSKSEPDYITDPSSILETYDEEIEKEGIAIYKKVQKAAQNISEYEKILLGKKIFGENFGKMLF